MGIVHSECQNCGMQFIHWAALTQDLPDQCQKYIIKPSFYHNTVSIMQRLVSKKKKVDFKPELPVRNNSELNKFFDDPGCWGLFVSFQVTNVTNSLHSQPADQLTNQKTPPNLPPQLAAAPLANIKRFFLVLIFRYSHILIISVWLIHFIN